MNSYYKSTLDLIGNTPLVEVTNIENEQNLEAAVLVKLEYFNPGLHQGIPGSDLRQ